MYAKITKNGFLNRQSSWVALITLLFAGLLCIEELYAKKDPPPTPDPVIPPVACNCIIPPFVATQAKPNILIILDNSNSMDEDFYGGAVGSFSVASKSDVARTVLSKLITETRQMLRIGLMTYKLPTSGIQSYYIHNSPYFTSYDPRSFCPNPPEACSSYCEGTSSDGPECSSACVAQNSQFTLPPADEITTLYPVGSDEREKYCRLTYPKTKSQPNPNHPFDNNSTLYFKHSLPFYSSINQHVAFCYSPTYNYLENTNDVYKCYADKSGSSDSFSGYSGTLLYDGYFIPTDSDLALGFKDFGRRLSWYDVGKTWYINSSPGTGKLHVDVADIADFNGTLTSSYTSLMNKLRPMDGNSTRYMSCTLSNKNDCSYIVNAGLTPTAGTLEEAIKYFSGTSPYSSPIESACQDNFIIYVTDGLPSVNESGGQADSASLMPTVYAKLEALRTLTKGTNTRGVKTFVLGMGLLNESRAYLDQMAVEGNTTIEGHAYYADSPEEFVNALRDIFGNIVLSASSATSVSILSEKTRQGANLIQAVFYPSKVLDTFGSKSSWLGYLYAYWLHISRTTTTIREDTVQDTILNLVQDYVLNFYYDTLTGVNVDRYRDANGDGNIDEDEIEDEHVDTVSMDETSPLWEAGKVLSRRSAASRTIYTVTNTPSTPGAAFGPLIPFNDGNSSAFISLMGNPLTFDACLGNDNSTRRTNLINYVRGTDTRNTTTNPNRSCRNRTFTADGQSYTWKLGDIVYSTPQDVIDYKFCYDPTLLTFDNETCTQNSDCAEGKRCRKKESVIFAGANDGMLHAFKTGIINNEVDAPKVASLWPSGATDFGKELWGFIPKNSLPYLRMLAAPGYCHLSYVDLSPYITNMTTPQGIRKVLIGGMRFGGAPAPGMGSAEPPPWDTCGSTVTCTDINTCYNPQPYDGVTNPGGCTGLSSYYALDITNPEKPVFLWEFTHPNLGYSYSGPAVITRNGKYHVMFLSGPTGLDGGSTQNLYAFILTLDPADGIDRIESLYVWDGGESVKNAIGGRLFTSGVDTNVDGNTDFVFFGESDTPSGKLGALKGGVVRLWIKDDPPNEDNWEFTIPFLNLAKQPITAKVEVAKCFNQWYLYLGSGRYFTTADNYPVQEDYIMAVPLYCTSDEPSSCPKNINYTHGSKEEVCAEVSGSSTTPADKEAWLVELEPADESPYNYYKERLITDPTVTSQNMVFFTTTQPYGPGRPCDSGGRTRLWGLNCATGEAITDTSCAGKAITDATGTIYLQTSTGTINKVVVTDAFTQEDGKASEWLEGIPPETSTPFVGRYQGNVGKIMHWIEK